MGLSIFSIENNKVTVSNTINEVIVNGTMEKKQSRYINTVFAFVILVLFFVSCKSESYLDLLTGGSIRYWQYLEHKDYYMSFEKRTRRVLDCDANLKADYLNGLDLLSKGRHFKISGNRVTTWWKVHGYKIPVDTFDILEIDDHKMVLKWTYGVGPVPLIKYIKK